MEHQNEKESFSYIYSAKEQSEINAIRNKYLPKEADKMEQLRRLDEGVNRKGTAASLAVGIIGALMMGLGMSLIMTDFGSGLGVFWCYALGIIIGVLGMIPVCLAYPVYLAVLKKERQRIAPEVLRLSEELLK